MGKLTDQELMTALQERLDRNSRAIVEQNDLLKELEKVNQKLIDSEKLKSQFLSNIRNEINNPLTSILGLSQGIPKKANDVKALEKTSRLIYKEAFSLDFQLRNVFIAAELESGGLYPEISNVDINSLVHKLVDDFQHLLIEKSITVEVVNNCEKQYVHSDNEKVYLILSNLLANAIEYSNSETSIIIEIGSLDKNFTVSIKDNGIGIDKEYHELIYDRFHQLDSGSTKDHLGHGLGLSVSRELLELIEGSIYLESEPGEGSTFTISVKENENATENITLSGNEFLFEEGEDILF